MKRASTLGIAALLLAGSSIAQAQSAPKIGGLLQLWYHQGLDNNLRINSAPSSPLRFYDLSSRFTENQFIVRRADLKISGGITADVAYEISLDPAINTSTSNPSILKNAFITYKFAENFEFKVGQYKNMQTMEGPGSSSELIFAERSQLGRVFGDKRDRGAEVSYSWGNPKDLAAKFTVGAFNGMNDAIQGKGNDANPQKDFVLRADFTMAKFHKFGVYTLSGLTDQADKGALVAKTFATSANNPTAAAILDEKDATSNLGLYYQFQNADWLFNGELITGKLGRRFPTVGAAGAGSRQHLDQKFMGYYVTGQRTWGKHSVALRYDAMNYNSGSDWYTTFDPYTESAPSVATGRDYTPEFTEISLGYTYAFTPEKVKAANIKVNYIARSKNFLAPRVGQTGEQGGDSLVIAYQVSF